MITTRQTCRICGSSALAPVLSLGDQYISSNFAISRSFPPVERKVPLDLVRCDPAQNERGCGLVQLRHTISGDLMYSSYGYRSGINQTMIDHLGNLARGLEKRAELGARDLVVDIGANDGTLLSQYETKGPTFVGFEPSNIQPERPTPELKYVRDYFTAASLARYAGGRKAKVITSIAMFYDLEAPNAFVADVAASLAEDGLWVLEMSYLPSMLANNSFDTICHEHLEYYSLGTIEKLLQAHGLKVADAELNDSNGGSIRVTVCHQGSPRGEHSEQVRARVYAIRKREFEMQVDTDVPYRAFAENTEAIRAQLGPLLLDLRSRGKTVFGYGASTKGNVILQYCGITPEHLTAIADRNPAKWGSVTLGTNIRIVAEDEMRAARPDYLLVLPWHFIREFQQREEAFLARGGRFIVPVPRVQIL